MVQIKIVLVGDAGVSRILMRRCLLGLSDREDHAINDISRKSFPYRFVSARSLRCVLTIIIGYVPTGRKYFGSVFSFLLTVYDVNTIGIVVDGKSIELSAWVSWFFFLKDAAQC